MLTFLPGIIGLCAGLFVFYTNLPDPLTANMVWALIGAALASANAVALLMLFIVRL